MRIRSKLLLAFLITVLVTGTVSIVVVDRIATDVIVQQVDVHLQATSQARAHHIDTYLLMEKQKTEQLSKDLTIKDMLSLSPDFRDRDYRLALVYRRLRNVVANSEFTYNALVFDTAGTVVVSSNPEDVGMDVGGNPSFIASMTNTSIAGPYVLQPNGMPTLIFSAPIIDDAFGTLLGVIATEVSMGALNTICEDHTGFGQTGEAYLLNGDGFMLTPSRFIEGTFLTQKVETAVVQAHFSQAETLRGSDAEMQTLIYEDYRGVEVLGTHAHIQNAPWILIAEQNTTEALAPAATLSRTLVWVFAVLAAVAVILAFKVSGSMAGPVLALHAGVEELAKGNLRHRVGTEDKSEIGELSRAFDALAANLQQSREQLEHYSKGLESMVAQRTEELTKTNVELSQEIELRKIAEQARKSLIDDLRLINERLDASNKELQDFAYVASHDLREPLRKISSFGSLLADSLKGKLNEDEEENLGFMVDGAQRMQSMIEALLTYSRVTTKSKPAEAVNLNDVIAELQQFEIASMLEETGGSVRVPRSLPSVYGDPSQMRQLFQNLVANGLKFHRSGIPPEITITWQDDEKAGNVRIEVSDNGIGIPSEYYGQLFTMFKRLHSRAEYEGTGIGLAVCKKIVERHGGKIGIQSAPGEGSTFWLTLPVTSEQIERKE